MGIKDVFKKNKKSSSLAKYTIGELESLKTIYEKQLEELDSPMSCDGYDVNLSADFCVNSFDGNAHIKNQIKRDLADVIAEIHKRKSEPEKEREA
jgi:hypothetical protein